MGDLVTIELEIPDDLLLACAIRAHELDMKLNDFIVKALEWHMMNLKEDSKS